LVFADGATQLNDDNLSLFCFSGLLDPVDDFVGDVGMASTSSPL
jgi:hypothetical protein